MKDFINAPDIYLNVCSYYLNVRYDILILFNSIKVSLKEIFNFCFKHKMQLYYIYYNLFQEIFIGVLIFFEMSLWKINF